ncbi:MAG: DnaA regulatory inactivator Hda [Methyloprofundus sp.]|nr:DnaA regulatory inactivator Hda [Methyloprofundus sp.]
MAEQLTLQFENNAEQSFASFYTGDNLELISHLKNIVNNSGEQQLFIWGDKGSGKSHLLHASCQEAHNNGFTAFYLNLANPSSEPSILEGLESFDLVCLDNIQSCSNNKEWELGLFNFYNRQRANDRRLLISGDCPPKFLMIQLPDLKTRLNWGLTLKIQELSDENLIAAFTCKAKYIGLDISPTVGEFIKKNYSRDAANLWLLLPKLEQATLVAKRKLSIPFLKNILSAEK